MRDFARRHLLTANTIRYRIEYRVLVDLIREEAGAYLGDTLLDAGAGSGQFSKKLQTDDYCKKLIALEPAQDNYDLLIENYGEDENRLTIQAGLLDIPMEISSVDCVVSTQVFEHIEDDRGAAAEVARILRPGGYALISTPHPPELFPNDGHVRPGYTEEEMEGLFKEFQFERLGTRYFFHLANYT